MKTKTRHKVKLPTDSLISILKAFISILRSNGHLLIYIVSDPQKQFQLDKAPDAFDALNDIVWGEFYKNNIKHGGANALFETPLAALMAYRGYITDAIEQRKLHQD